MTCLFHCTVSSCFPLDKTSTQSFQGCTVNDGRLAETLDSIETCGRNKRLSPKKQKRRLHYCNPSSRSTGGALHKGRPVAPAPLAEECVG